MDFVIIPEVESDLEAAEIVDDLLDTAKYWAGPNLSGWWDTYNAKAEALEW
jgi:hypothetical protein